MCYGKSLGVVILASVLWTIYFLFSSFSNFFKNHHYLELGNTKNIYDYDESNSNIDFKKYLKEELANCSGHNFEINKIRTEDLANSKKGIFFALIATLIFSIICLISIL